jgi:hypothetical protein
MTSSGWNIANAGNDQPTSISTDDDKLIMGALPDNVCYADQLQVID